MFSKNQNIYKATLNALEGFKVLISERAARREIIVFIFSISCLLYNPNLYTFVLVLLCLLLLSIEAINSSLERLCDFLTNDINVSIRKIKDLAACAVFFIVLSMIFVTISWYFDFANVKS